MKERWSVAIDAVLVLAALSAYLKELDDVVWNFIQGTLNAPSPVRLLKLLA
jgi:hypothetical protein